MDTTSLRPIKEAQNQKLFIETTVVDEPEPSSKALLVTTAQRINPRMSVALRLVLFAVLTTGAVKVMTGGVGSIPALFGASHAVDDIRQQLGSLNDEAAREEKQVWDNFAQRLQDLAAQNRAACEAGVGSAVNSLVRHDQIGWLITDFAQDKVFGGRRASDRVESCATGLTEPMKSAAVRTIELLDSLALELAAVNNRYAMKVGDVIESHKAALPKMTLEHLAAVPHGLAPKVTNQVGAATLAVTFEGFTVGATQKAIANLRAMLVRKLGPQITKAVTGVGAAAADGPLPFGDILTVGLALWTVWDVVSLPGDIRADVRSHFEAAVNQHLTALNEQMERSVREIAQRQRSVREQVSAQVLASL